MNSKESNDRALELKRLPLEFTFIMSLTVGGMNCSENSSG